MTDLSRYRLIFDRSPIGIFCYDRSLRITEFNESFVRILHSKAERLQSLDMTRVTDLSVMPALRRALRGENGYYLGPYRPTTGTGEIHVSLRCIPLLDERGLVEGGIGTVEDVTERREAELEQERYMAGLSFLAGTALQFLDLPPDGDIYGLVADRLSHLVGDAVILVNSYDQVSATTETKVAWGLGSSTKRLLSLLGRDPVGMRLAMDEDAAMRLRSGRFEQVEGVHALTFGRLPKPLCTALEELFAVGEIWSMGFTARDELLGNVVVVLKKGGSLKDPAALEAFVSQASVALLRKRAEDARRESEDKAAYAFAASPDSILIARLEDGAIVEANESFFAAVGRSRDETLGRRASDLQKWARPEDRSAFLRQLLRDGLVSNFDTLIETRSGEAMSTLMSGRIIEMGGEKCVLTIARDISDRKRFEEELRASENTYRTIFENKGTATAIIEADGTISLANGKALELLGSSREEIEGKRKWSDFVLEPDLTRMKKLHALRLTDPAAAPKNYEFRGFGKDGQARDVLVNIDVIPGQSKSVASFLDITDQKRAQEEIQRAAKLESLGLLAGGIAHDFNNLLGALLGNLSLARDELQSAPTNKEQLASYLEASEKAVLRARDLTQQLLTFSMGGAPVKRVASLATVLEDSVHFVLSGSQHQPQMQIDPALWDTRMDPGQMSQVVQNLVLNAAQFMSEPGTITVTATNLTVRPTDYSLPLAPGKHVRVQVVDQGCGIPAENLPRVFDPFFTTRPESGSGLGLATSYRIVKQHDGLMTVDSTPG